MSVIAFHIYMILGFDADTFELNAGDVYFKQAQEILELFSTKWIFWMAIKGWKTK